MDVSLGTSTKAKNTPAVCSLSLDKTGGKPPSPKPSPEPGCTDALPASTWGSLAEEEGGMSIPSVVLINVESGFRWPEKEIFLFKEVFKAVMSVINSSLVGSGKESI